MWSAVIKGTLAEGHDKIPPTELDYHEHPRIHGMHKCIKARTKINQILVHIYL